MDVDLIREQATIVPADPLTPIGVYIRTAAALWDAANEKDALGEKDHAVILFLRFLNLVLHTLPKHKEFVRFKNSPQMNTFRQQCTSVLELLSICCIYLVGSYFEERKRNQVIQAHPPQPVYQVPAIYPSAPPPTLVDPVPTDASAPPLTMPLVLALSSVVHSRAPADSNFCRKNCRASLDQRPTSSQPRTDALLPTHRHLDLAQRPWWHLGRGLQSR